jgi:short-subunit dehydrogenase
MELADEGLMVMTCCPGTVSTEFFTAAPKPGKVWDWRLGSALQPLQVAKVILRQLRRRGPRRWVIPWFARWTANLYVCWPRLGEWVMGRALKSMRNRQ